MLWRLASRFVDRRRFVFSDSPALFSPAPSRPNPEGHAGGIGKAALLLSRGLRRSFGNPGGWEYRGGSGGHLGGRGGRRFLDVGLCLFSYDYQIRGGGDSHVLSQGRARRRFLLYGEGLGQAMARSSDGGNYSFVLLRHWQHRAELGGCRGSVGQLFGSEIPDRLGVCRVDLPPDSRRDRTRVQIFVGCNSRAIPRLCDPVPCHSDRQSPTASPRYAADPVGGLCAGSGARRRRRVSHRTGASLRCFPWDSVQRGGMRYGGLCSCIGR